MDAATEELPSDGVGSGVAGAYEAQCS